ncbi:aldehyde dehydrogenase domain-containing protein [Leucosporidium creatinivorum]|uniref:Aldehyde dehydrogenase domain-containing protein n=1 Tax=Leucosporidium creatinivorum TaxID=106004 RepID=A0A1Y2FG40_9BASI|nr:aldehyde dehydrogenase domain-containing protein [Leucosporidium creatinivorum]
MSPPPTIETRLFLSGTFTLPHSPSTFPLFNPATGEHVADVHEAGLEDVDKAVKAAKEAQPAWGKLSGAERASRLEKLASLLERDGEKIGQLDAISMGRPVSGQLALDIPVSSSKLRFDASLAHSLVGQSSFLSGDGTLNMVWHQPYGVTAAVLPFNVPTIMWVSKVGPAVAAGNAIIVKSSEKSPLGALHLASLTIEAGFPPGIIQVISGRGDTGRFLAEHMEIRKISFTGSTRTGRLIAQAAAKSNLKAVALELGGKSPTIIFEDADLNLAVPATAFSISWNSGQICMANSRLYVHTSIYPSFLSRFKSAFSTYKHGDPLSLSTTMGPQADDVQGKAVLGFIERGRKEGGKVEMGGERVGTEGYFIQPTIFTDVSEDADLNKNEVFGPVVGGYRVIHQFEDEEDVVRKANDSEFGLYAAVFTQDIDRAIRISKALEAGTVAINTSSPAGASEIPFGGFKSSGIGREGGLDSLKRWTEEKSVVLKYKA